MKLALGEIKGTEAKRQHGDITSLRKSIAELGLINPLTVDSDYKLLARRNGRMLQCRQEAKMVINKLRKMFRNAPDIMLTDEERQKKAKQRCVRLGHHEYREGKCVCGAQLVRGEAGADG